MFLLYTGEVLLKNILPNAHYDHFVQLFCAIRILCDPKLCVLKNNIAHEILKAYVHDFEFLYERSAVGYNIHNLLHLAADVNRLGHLDNFSAFRFENYMQFLKKLIRKKNQPLQQLHNRLHEIEYCTQKKKTTFEPHALLSNGLEDGYRDLKYGQIKYSVEPPNNYCLIGGNVFKIFCIFENDLDIYISGNFICNLRELFVQPFSSFELNISYTNTLEVIEDEKKTFAIQSIQYKIMSLVQNNKRIFIPIL